MNTTHKKWEDGNIIDNLAAIITMCFVFACMFVFIAYAKCVQMRMEADYIAKKYIYIMEENGYLDCETDSDRDLLIQDLKSKGFTNIIILPNTTTTQVAYGDKVTLSFQVTMVNPLYESIGGETRGGELKLDEDGYYESGGTLFTKDGLNPYLTFVVTISSTSKW